MIRMLFCVVFAVLPALQAAADAPGDSLYQLQVPLQSQAGEAIGFDRWRGQPVLVSMFYASCGFVCPTLIRNVQRLEEQLAPPARARLRVLMITLDPERDTPAALATLAAEHHADLARWNFARAGAGDVRKLAALLGIQYRQLPSGDFNHATVITLLDGEGRMVARTETIGKPGEEFVAALRRATEFPSPPPLSR